MLCLASRCRRDLAAITAGSYRIPVTAGEGSINQWQQQKHHRYLSTSTTHPAARLAGKVAVITGAASGFGKATAAEFIRNGAKVIIADINRRLGQQAAAALGPAATFIPCDVTQEPDIAAAVDLAVSLHGQLDILHSNAGIVGSLAPSIAALDLSDFDRTLAVNLRSAVAGIKHAARVMVPRRKGCVLCTASVTGVMGGMAPHGYSVSKAALIGLVRSAAAELSGSGVRVNCVSPFAVATPLGLDAVMEMSPGLSAEEAAEMIGRMGEMEGARCEAEDVAMAAVYLASDEAKYVSGHNLVVDGGFTAYKRVAMTPPSP